MKKYDLTDCSIIIPIEIDFKERLEHLNFLLEYFPRFFINYELVIIEHGKEPKIHLPPSLNIKYVFVNSEKDFSLAHLSNAGAAIVENPFFCKCDVDVYIHPKAIYESFQRLKSKLDLAFILPFNGVSFNIENPLRKQLMKSFDFDSLPCITVEDKTCHIECMTLKNKKSKGLIHLFNTSTFKALGGYNEKFVGWGYQDEEVVTRFKILGHPSQLLEGFNAFHLDHPRIHWDDSLVLKNKLLSEFIKTLTPEQLADYVSSWSRFIA